MPFLGYINVEPHDVRAVVMLDDGSTVEGSGRQHIEFLFRDDVFGHGATLTVTADGWKTHSQRVSLANPHLADVQLQKDTSNGFIQAEGEKFWRSGEPFTVALHTDFRLLRSFLDGDRDPLLAERIAAGSQGPRVFLTCDFLFKLGPHTHRQYWEGVRNFADYIASKGLIWEAVVYTDRQLTGLADALWNRACEALAGYPVLIQLVNEHFKNGVDPRAFGPIPNGCPQSAGSFVDGMFPVTNWGPNTYHAFNPSRGWKWPATVGITLWELKDGWPGVWLIDEPIGADEFDQPGRRASQPELFHRMGVDCAVWGAGGVFHSQAGLNSLPWGPVQRRCADAFFQGIFR